MVTLTLLMKIRLLSSLRVMNNGDARIFQHDREIVN
jgi:hypothetical protein